ncbi:MAG TPA: hypothetical protein VLV17_03295 [Anaeromyxobacteraceae bacterium]|nr:hypothetical protein [Anaeromyxobacteraceae bacterium]
MYTKKGAGTVEVTESAAQALLRRGEVTELGPEEEKVMRMRLGASLPLSTRLGRLPLATDAEIELLAYEIEAYLHLRERSRLPRTSSRAKEKIVRALRRKA